MLPFVCRRIVQSLLTIFGVMLLTFLLFRVISGDIAAAHLGQKATEQVKADWRHRHGYDRPAVINLHRRFMLTDRTEGDGYLRVEDGKGSKATGKLALIPGDDDLRVRYGDYRWWWRLDPSSPIERLMPKPPKKKAAAKTAKPAEAPPALMVLTPSNDKSFTVDFAKAKTVGELIDLINNSPDNRDAAGKPMVAASIAPVSLAPSSMADTQFVDHLVKSVTFQSTSLVHKQKLTEIIAERAPKSLALTVPTMAVGWILGLTVAVVVAYYRGSAIDKVGVFLSVLGMCVPFLAWMIYGQWALFAFMPERAYGLDNPSNIYFPIAIMVVAGLGGSVRFYRTVILDETNRDYVRTARAKGLPLPSVLFRHVLRNCMLPILTNLVMAIPFLIMGSLLVETFFGIPGLGDLMISSINGRDEPIISGMVFLMALIYTFGVLLTDLSYAVFDPRVRLR